MNKFQNCNKNLFILTKKEKNLLISTEKVKFQIDDEVSSSNGRDFCHEEVLQRFAVDGKALKDLCPQTHFHKGLTLLLLLIL